MWKETVALCQVTQLFPKYDDRCPFFPFARGTQYVFKQHFCQVGWCSHISKIQQGKMYMASCFVWQLLWPTSPFKWDPLFSNTHKVVNIIEMNSKWEKIKPALNMKNYYIVKKHCFNKHLAALIQPHKHILLVRFIVYLWTKARPTNTHKKPVLLWEWWHVRAGYLTLLYLTQPSS